MTWGSNPDNSTPEMNEVRRLKAEIERLRAELKEVQDAWYGRCVLIEKRDNEIERLQDEVRRYRIVVEPHEIELVAEIERLRALLKRSLEYLEHIQDEGPPGEGWKSDELMELIREIEKEPRP